MVENIFIEANPKARKYFFMYVIFQVFIVLAIFPLVEKIQLTDIRYLFFIATTCLMFWPAAFYCLWDVKKAMPFTVYPMVNARLPFRMKQRHGYYAKISWTCQLSLCIVFLLLPLFWLYGWKIETDMERYQNQLEKYSEESFEISKNKLNELKEYKDKKEH